jgi:hypothetical protein
MSNVEQPSLQAMASANAPLQELNTILDGIDRCQTDQPEGWWETSTGAEFGARKLAEVKTLVQRLVNTEGILRRRLEYFEGLAGVMQAELETERECNEP